MDHVKLKQNLSTNLRTLRSMRRASLEDFSEELGIGKTTLQDLEKGNGNPTLETIEHISQNLSISPLTLLSNRYDPHDLYTAQMLLSNIKTLCTLSREEQLEAVMLFDQLIRLINKSSFDGGNGK